jgi:AmmeMemoRadiSam system protein A
MLLYAAPILPSPAPTPDSSSPEAGSGETLSAADRLHLLRVARETLESVLVRGVQPRIQSDAPALLRLRACFVTLRRRDTGELRGCRGECIAVRPLIDSVARMALAAALDDTRFKPVRAHELPAIRIEISALTAPIPIRPEEVAVGRHGLILSAGQGGSRRAGLLLPQVPGEYGWDRDEYLDALCRKAGLPPSALRDPRSCLEAFEAEVWAEE